MSRLTLYVLVCASALLGAVRASHAADWALAADEIELRAGATIAIDVIYAGTGSAKFPESLAARARAGAYVWTLELVAAAPAQGMRRRYTTTLPTAARGSVILDLVTRNSSKLVFIAGAAPDPVSQLVEARPARSVATPPVDRQGLPGVAAMPGAESPGEVRMHEPIMSAYEPMYLLIGTRQGTSARFQLSFKYRLFDDDSGWGKDRPWLTGFYFAYTQNSLWDLSAQSRPFRDTSYRPSVFWQWQRTDDRGSRLGWIDAARVGLEHESNGKDGLQSRSINTAFVQPAWRWKFPDQRVLSFEPRFQAYLEKRDNPDIQKYRGYADWRARLGREDGLILAGNLRIGTSGRGSVQLDASYPVRDELFGRIGGYFHVQYFNGYGEDILGYNQKRDAQIRFGFSIVR